jgi:splicing factor 3A subunit 3
LAGDKICGLNREILSIQKDEDGILQDEITRIQTSSINSFYNSLNSSLEFYDKFSEKKFLYPEVSTIIENSVNVNFSGEEIFGKYLDLNEPFQLFSNLIKQKSPDQDYLQYLDRFNHFFYISDEIKLEKSYLNYLLNLWSYLERFYRKINPLVDLDGITTDWEKEFAHKLSIGDIKVSKKKTPFDLRLGMYETVKELEALGMERLKNELDALGLKCGGTLEQRAARLWTLRGKSMDEIPGNLKAKKTSSTGSCSFQEEVNYHNFPAVYNLCFYLGCYIRVQNFLN